MMVIPVPPTYEEHMCVELFVDCAHYEHHGERCNGGGWAKFCGYDDEDWPCAAYSAYVNGFLEGIRVNENRRKSW